MAVLPMKKAFLCGLKKDRKRTLEYLQRQGVLEVSEEIGRIYYKGFSQDEIEQLEGYLRRILSNVEGVL